MERLFSPPSAKGRLSGRPLSYSPGSTHFIPAVDRHWVSRVHHGPSTRIDSSRPRPTDHAGKLLAGQAAASIIQMIRRQGDAESTNAPRHWDATSVREHLGRGGHSSEGPAGSRGKANGHVLREAAGFRRAGRISAVLLLQVPSPPRVASLRPDRLYRLRAVCHELPRRLDPRGKGTGSGPQRGAGHELYDRLRKMPALWALHPIVPGGLYRAGLFARAEPARRPAGRRRLFPPAGRGRLGSLGLRPDSHGPFHGHHPVTQEKDRPQR
jgi:hypothetical protein